MKTLTQKNEKKKKMFGSWREKGIVIKEGRLWALWKIYKNVYGTMKPRVDSNTGLG